MVYINDRDELKEAKIIISDISSSTNPIILSRNNLRIYKLRLATIKLKEEKTKKIVTNCRWIGEETVGPDLNIHVQILLGEIARNPRPNILMLKENDGELA